LAANEHGRSGVQGVGGTLADGSRTNAIIPLPKGRRPLSAANTWPPPVAITWATNWDCHAHRLLGGLISFYLATDISVIALMDHPYRGELGLSPDAFQLIYGQVMQQ
jgi:hypothetical protein